MLPFKFDIKLFFSLSLAFILATIIGTVSHEFGHYSVAKFFGYTSSISFASTNWDDNKTRPFIDSTYSKYYNQIESDVDFPGKKRFIQIKKEYTKDSFWITLGGPLQTMLTGTIGLILLIQQKRKIARTNVVNRYQWFTIFLTLFWLRQLTNFIVGLLIYFLHGKFPERGDEFKLAYYSKLPTESIGLMTAVIALLITLFITFKIIPSDKRLTFITAGLIGGIFGYNFWLVWYGPVVMP